MVKTLKSEQQRIEADLQRNLEKYTLFLEQINDAVFIHKLDGEILAVNEKACELLGLEAAQLIEKQVTDFRPEGFSPEKNYFLQLSKQNGHTRFGSSLQRADGEIIDVEISSRLVDPENEIVLGIVRDITAQMKDRWDLARQANELKLLDKVRSVIMGGLELSVVYPTILDAISDAFDYELACISLLEGDMLVKQCSIGDANLPDAFPLSEGIMGRAARTGQPQFVEDVHSDSDYLDGTKGVVSEISIPLFDEDKVVGVLNIESNNPGQFNKYDFKLMIALGEKINLAIRNSHLYQSERNQRKIAEAHAEITAALSSSLNLEDTLDFILDNLGKIIPYDAANIMLIESGVARSMRARGYEKYGIKEAKYVEEIRLNVSEVANMIEMVATGKALIIPDIRDYAGWVGLNDRWIRAHLGAPILVGKEAIGFLHLDDPKPNAFSEEQAAQLEVYADQVAIALHNARLFTQVEESQERYRKLFETELEQRAIMQAQAEITAALNSTLNLDEVLDLILINLEKVIPYDAANIMLIESGIASTVRTRGYEKYGLKEAKALANIKLTVSEIAHMVKMMASRQAHLISDVHDYPGWVNRNNGKWIRAHLGAPIRVGKQTIGFLHLDDPRPNTYTDQHATLLEVFADQVAIALNNVQLFENMQRSEEYYRTLFEAPFEAIIISEGGIILEINQAFEKMYGYSSEDAKGMPILEIVAEESRAIVEHMIQEKSEDRFEAIELKKDGSEFPAKIYAKYIQYQGQEVRVTAIRDISKQLAAEEEIKQRNRDLASLNKISMAINESMNLDDILEVALQEIVSSTEVDGAECHLLDDKGLLALRMVYGMDETFAKDSLEFRFPPGEGIPGRAFERREPVYVPNAQTDQHYWRQELAKVAGYTSLLCIPILGNKGLLGTFMLYSYEPREFPEQLQTLMMTAGSHLAAAVNNAQLYDLQQKLTSRQTSLYETLKTIGEHLDPETVIQTAAEKIAEFTDWPIVNILTPDQPAEAASMLIVRAWGGRESKDYKEFNIPIDHGITSRAFRTNQIQIVADVSQDADYIERDPIIKSELSVPLRHGDRTLGVLDIQCTELNGFNQEDILLAESLADAIALTLENANLFTQAKTEISERISAERALREMNDNLEMRVEERTEELQQSLEQLEVTLDGVILSMARIVEFRDPYTAGHQFRTSELAEMIGIEMGLEKDQLIGLKKAAIIHDVGKINTPSEILSKPGKLTDIETEVIRDHVRVGEEIVRMIDFPWPVVEIIGQHHERLDGSGYPRGLNGDEICIEARIVAVADVVEAMLSDRPYRPGLELKEVLQEIKSNAGKLYDPQVVKICLDLFTKKKFKF